mgnify:FL=1
MKLNTDEVLKHLLNYIENENYKGWDPYDLLNSSFLKNSPLYSLSFFRLLFIQLGKRSPFNLRRLLNVPKEHNSKGLALILMGYINLYKIAINGNTKFGNPETLKKKIEYLSELLVKKSCAGYSGACWGYNFPWQARNLFYFPKETPTVVATSFCSEALFKSYEITKNKLYLNTALSSANFILKDLNKKIKKNGDKIISYSPIPGNDEVFNASALGAKVLSYCYKYTENIEFKSEAKKIISYVAAEQEHDGSWVYGKNKVQNWKDSFHTGYIIESMNVYQKFCKDYSYKKEIDKGFNFYINNFFMKDGTPKYYDKKIYPVDIHCPAQLWNTLYELNLFKNHKIIAEKVYNWTITNLYNKNGYFYYQKNRFFKSKISYMRWSNAFVLKGLSCFELYKNEI